MYQKNIHDAPISLLRRIACISSFIQKLAVSNFYMNIAPLSSVNSLFFICTIRFPCRNISLEPESLAEKNHNFLLWSWTPPFEPILNWTPCDRRTNQISVENFGSNQCIVHHTVWWSEYWIKKINYNKQRQNMVFASLINATAATISHTSQVAARSWRWHSEL